MREFPKLPAFQSSLGKYPNVAAEPTFDSHRLVRRMMAPSFSNTSLSQQEPVILRYINLLMEQLRKSCQDDGGVNIPIDIVSWYKSVTFDIIGDLTFGKSFGSVENGKLDPWVKNISNFADVGLTVLLCSAHLNLQRFILKVYSWFNIAQANHIVSLKRTLEKRLETRTERHDLVDGLVQGIDGKVCRLPAVKALL